MNPTNIALFDLAERRLAWSAQRQSVLASNLANADTPGWRARDLPPFSAALAGAGALQPVTTDPAHIATATPSAGAPAETAGERSPDGNSVSVDGELVKVAETDLAHSTAADLYKAYLGMFRTAIGR